MEIEQKERERIEADIDAYIKDLWHDVNSPNNNSPKIVEAITHFRAGKQSEHLHLQKEVIQPLRKSLEDEQATAQHWLTEYKKLEAEIKALREALGNSLQIMEQTVSNRKAYGITGGDVFLDLAIAEARELLKNEG